MHLPTLDPDIFDTEYRLNPAAWKPAVAEICAAHGLPVEPFHPFTDGSNLVAMTGGAHVVKVFPPFHANQWESEWRVLAQVQGRLSYPVPGLIASGTRPDGWYYLIMTVVPGHSLEAVWPRLTVAAKADILRRIGEMMAGMHQIPVGDLLTLPPEWTGFLETQVKACRARHTRLQAPEWLLRDLETYVQEALPELPLEFSPVILTGEYTPFNLLASPGASGWEISGMIDFGDGMVGFAEYDLLGPAAFLVEGNPVLMEALLKGYGHEPMNPQLRTRLMLMLLLHRYSNLKRQVCIPGWETAVSSMNELAHLIFPG